MSKKRKTKKEKMISSQRRQVIVENTLDSLTPSYSFKLEEKPIKKTTTQHAPTTHNYSYVYKDAKNTLLITSILVALSIFTYIILKIQLISLFGIVF